MPTHFAEHSSLVVLALGLIGGAWLVIRESWRALRVPGERALGRDGAILAAILVVFVTLAVTIPDMSPVHDHDTFVARADCARDPACLESPRGAWNMPTLHVFRWLFGLVPYRVQTLGWLSLGACTLSLALLFFFVREMFSPDERSRGTRVALWTVGILAFHPLFLRLSVDTPFWPYAMLCVLAAGLAALHAARTDDAIAWCTAACFFALSLQTNMVLLVLAPLGIVAPLAWTRGRWRPSVGGTALLVAIAAFVLLNTPSEVVPAVARDPRYSRFLGGVVRVITENLFLDSRLTPLTVAIATAVGLYVALRYERWRMAPVLLAHLAADWALSAQVRLFDGYPTRFLHGMLSLYFLALLAGMGAEWLATRAARRGPAIAASVVALTLALWPTTRESIAFLTDERHIAGELAALSPSFERLPPHDVLVIPPEVMPALSRPRSDPVELFFPVGEYRYVMETRGLRPGLVIRLDELLQRPEAYARARVLFYLGMSLKTFLRSEIEDGVVPASLEQPLLTELRSRFHLVPELLFSIRTYAHPAIVMRLTADRSDLVELGFYRVEPLGAADASADARAEIEARARAADIVPRPVPFPRRALRHLAGLPVVDEPATH